MSFNYYPKNWHANGYGWHNTAAMQTGWKAPPHGMTKAPDAYSTGSSSSGVSSMCPYPTSGTMGMPTPHAPSPAPSNYGFVMPPPLPQMPGAPLYPPLSFGGSSGSLPSMAGGSAYGSAFGSGFMPDPNPPLVPPTISGYGLEEIPCASVKVPEDQLFFTVNTKQCFLTWTFLIR
ncbi:hypothetical protein DMENIID0001_115890 [Sergentomyia squamirostris]